MFAHHYSCLNSDLDSAAQAPQTRFPISYDYLEFGYASIKITTESSGKVTFGGFGGALSKSFSRSLYGTFTYSSVKKDDCNLSGGLYDFKINQMGVNIGARMPLSPNTDLFGEVGVLRSTKKFTGDPDESQTDYPATIGVRSVISESFETLVSANVLDGAWTGNLGLTYKINKQFGVGLFYGVADDGTSITGGLRLYF